MPSSVGSSSWSSSDCQAIQTEKPRGSCFCKRAHRCYHKAQGGSIKPDQVYCHSFLRSGHHLLTTFISACFEVCIPFSSVPASFPNRWSPRGQWYSRPPSNDRGLPPRRSSVLHHDPWIHTGRGSKNNHASNLQWPRAVTSGRPCPWPSATVCK